MPASTRMSGALVKAEPYALRQLHWHLGHNEWQFLINGTLEVRPPWCADCCRVRNGEIASAARI